jgi:hypothetical protein
MTPTDGRGLVSIRRGGCGGGEKVTKKPTDCQLLVVFYVKQWQLFIDEMLQKGKYKPSKTTFRAADSH